MAMRWRLPNARALRALIVWNGFILRRRRGRGERLIGPRSSLGREPEPTDELALELVIGHRLRQEVGAAEITDALAGIGEHLAQHLALDRIGAIALQRRLDRARQARR